MKLVFWSENKHWHNFKRFSLRGGLLDVILSHDNVAHLFKLLLSPGTPGHLSLGLNGLPGEPIELFRHQSAGGGSELPPNVGPEENRGYSYFRLVQEHPLKYYCYQHPEHSTMVQA